MPFRVIYIFSDIGYFLIYYIVGYRKNTVIKNLTNSFPEKDKKEIERITKDYFRFLTDLIFEGIKGMSMSQRQVLKRHKLLNPELLDADYEAGRPVIGVTGHYGNWEWGAFSSGIQLKHIPIGFYRQLSNKYIDKYLRARRAKFNCKLVSVKKTYDTFIEYKDKTIGYIMVADQSPTKAKLKESYWIKFLNQDTPCLYGPEKYAKMYNLPVYYIDIKRIKRGYYTLYLKKITDSPNRFKDGELTTIFMKELEDIIKAEPAYWLWSHNRWKYNKPN
jgi:KDO2-lipid IV(A) lauroyltransferase